MYLTVVDIWRTTAVLRGGCAASLARLLALAPVEFQSVFALRYRRAALIGIGNRDNIDCVKPFQSAPAFFGTHDLELV